jgi:hypothetical protein
MEGGDDAVLEDVPVYPGVGEGVEGGGEEGRGLQVGCPRWIRCWEKNTLFQGLAMLKGIIVKTSKNAN